MTPTEQQTVDTERQLCLVRFSPCGGYLFGGSYDARIRRWRVSGDEIRPLEPVAGHSGWVSAFAFSPAADSLVSADSWGHLRAWAYCNGELELRWQVPHAHDGWIRSLAISPDSTKVLTAGRDGFIRVWSTYDGRLGQELAADDRLDVFCVAFHPCGTSAVSGDLRGRLTHWDLESGARVRQRTLEKMHRYERIQDVPGLKMLSFVDGGATLVCAGGQPTRTGQVLGIPTVQLIDWHTFLPTKTWEFGSDREGFVFDLAWHPLGWWLLVTSGAPGAGQFLGLRPEDEKPFFTYSKLANCHSLAVHPDGKRLVVSATNRNSQGNGAVLDKQGNYQGNFSPLRVFELS